MSQSRHYFSIVKDPEIFESKDGYETVLEFYNKYYYQLMNCFEEKMCNIKRQNKGVRIHDIHISYAEVAEIFEIWKYDLKDIPENKKQNTRNDLTTPREQDISFKYYSQLRELFEYNQIQADIVQQKEVINKKMQELNNYKFDEIDSWQTIK